ncbi:MAG: hypothetical protein SO018_06565 [Ligilactobacillus saerimneri]|nr:hypothetical protein [Ligilactobacillus saerimneri]
MTASDFQSMFERAAESSQEKIQQNGYDKPDKKVNDSSSTATSESTLSVHLTGGQSSIDYITKKMGDQGWEIEGGTYGGAHGAPTDGDYVPYNSVRNDSGDMYRVYQDGRIEKED